MEEKQVHLGRNIRRVREIMDIKQEALAIDLGISQQSVSKMEMKETIEPEMLEKVAAALNVPVDIIKNYSEEAVMYNIQNNYEGSSNSGNNYNSNYQCTFNPLDRVVELYERLLSVEREKVELLERMMKEKK